ncbi:cyclic nucleotide-binding protein [Actinomycetospora succinea]|uniref:histidine kinase n=1 Tax=Actinomycetospora succinea TaxID=663603 RepID=A0A4V3D8R5_9PSEU|nr:ATP-binding protein [Actinomycetospora succinea]TDQ52861.1 cyclic nucleotide-binding protein [Actinomycetospora succinea]
MTTTEQLPDKVTRDELRELFLFEKLDDDQLDWLAAHGDRVAFPAGETVCREGEPASCFWVLLTGEISMAQTIRGDEVETTRTSQRGAYGGSMQAYIPSAEQTYQSTLRATRPSTLLALPAAEWADALRTWFPLPIHLLEGLVVGMRRTSTIQSERERLLALGSLSAGLTHELNNPAAAAQRATESLRSRVAGMRHKLGLLACGKLDGPTVAQLVELQEDAVNRAETAPELSALEASDAEDELGDWLDDRGVGGAWDLAPVLVAGGLDAEWLDKVERAVPEGSIEAAVRWIAYAVETETLMGEITDATARISNLVGAARQYSQLDRAPFQEVDLRDLLKSTMVMMSRKFEGIQIVKELDPDLPKIPAYAAELNQVWTNIIDNAVGAMHAHGDGTGTLTIRTRRDGPHAIVEIGDTGPGIPDDVRPRIFEPFFTTKDVGEGTGLGLDISWRIVVKKHHGDIRVHTGPGGTTFEVCLPLEGPAREDVPAEDEDESV